MNEPRTILVIMPNWIGDAVMATPSLKALRRSYPGSCICVAGLRPVIETVFDPAISDLPIELPAKSRGSLFRTIRLLRQGRFDMAVIFPNSFRSALAVFLGKVKKRVGYARDGRGFMLTDKAGPPVGEDGKRLAYPTLDYYADLLGVLGIDVDDRTMSLPIDPLPGETVLAEAGFQPDLPLVMVNPGAAYGPAKLWPAARYASLSDMLVDNFDAQVIINAAPAEQETARRVADAMRNEPLINFGARDNSLTLLKSLLSRCDLLVTNDTGARHIGVAAGTAVVTLYGSTDPRWTTLDYDRQKDVRAEVDCGPCQKKVCPLPSGPGRMACVERIAVEDVLAAASELLREGGRGDA